jgi:hypothetical protein
LTEEGEMMMRSDLIKGLVQTMLLSFLFHALPCSSADEPLRILRYTSRSAEEARAWQKDLRSRLFTRLKMDDLTSSKSSIPVGMSVGTTEAKEGYQWQEIEFQSTPGRRIKAILTVPNDKTTTHPAVVCIHGHGGDRHSPYEPGIYNGFATELARRGMVTIAVDVGQHNVYEADRTLMGERLWDVIRCVDLLISLPEVDQNRIGCAGLSLGGEMAMWLGAMDERVAAVVSAGFLTRMSQMEKGHCQCWRFEGLRELVDWADVYSLIAPRALLCQNGLKEPPADFIVPLAREALEDVKLIYKDMGAEDKVCLAVHDGAHVIDLPTLLSFFEKDIGMKDELSR